MAVQIRGLDELSENLKRVAAIVPSGDVYRALAGGGQIIVDQAQANVIENDLIDKGTLHDNIKVVTVGKERVDILVDVVYGAVHEFGLENQAITDRQRRFFWAMWAQTGNEMWKALALSETYTIPARPYVRPAVDEKKTEAVKEITRLLAIALVDKLRGRVST